MYWIKNYFIVNFLFLSYSYFKIIITDFVDQKKYFKYFDDWTYNIELIFDSYKELENCEIINHHSKIKN